MDAEKQQWAQWASGASQQHCPSPAAAAPTAGGVPWRQHVAALLANLASLCAGAAMGWSAAALPALQLSQEQGSWLGALLPLGALAGALPAGPLAARWGRRNALLASGAPLLAGWLLLAWPWPGSSQVWLMCAGRLLTGLAWGASSGPTALYCEEIADVSVRGALGTYTGVMISLGTLLVYALGALLPYRWYNAACCVPPIVFLVGFCWMPESPVFLAAAGRSEGARAARLWLRNRDPEDESPRKDSDTDPDGLASERPQGKTGWSEELCRPPTPRAMFLVVTVCLLHQFCGVNAFESYLVGIFQQSGSSLTPHASAVVAAAAMLVSDFATVALVDRVGRRPLLAASCAGSAACLAALATHAAAAEAAGPDWAWVPLLAVLLYFVANCAGLASVPWLLMAELLPVAARGWGSSVAVTLNRLAAFAVTKLFPGLLAGPGPVPTYGGLAAVCAAGAVFTLACVPETRGRSRRQIQRSLGAP